MSATSTRPPLLLLGAPVDAVEGAAAGVPDHDAQVAGRVLDLVDQEAPAGPALVLLHDSDPARSARATHQAALARRALGRDEVLVRHLPGPLTRFVLVARVLAACEAPVGVQAAALDDLAAQVRTVALLSSVSRLEQPAPTVAQHARGLLPGSRFLVDLSSGTVSHVPHRLPRGLARGGEAVTAAGTSSESAAWAADLQAAAGQTSGAPALTSPGRSWWGSPHWAELSVLSSTVSGAAARLAGAGTRQCGWCGRVTSSAASCPHCSSSPAPDDPGTPPGDPDRLQPEDPP